MNHPKFKFSDPIYSNNKNMKYYAIRQNSAIAICLQLQNIESNWGSPK